MDPYGRTIAYPFPCVRNVGRYAGTCLFTVLDSVNTTSSSTFGCTNRPIGFSNITPPFSEDLSGNQIPGQGVKFDLDIEPFPQCSSLNPGRKYFAYTSWVYDSIIENSVDLHIRSEWREIIQNPSREYNAWYANLPLVDPEISVDPPYDCNVAYYNGKCGVDISWNSKYFLPDAGVFYRATGTTTWQYVKALTQDIAGTINTGSIVGVNGGQFAVFQYSQDVVTPNSNDLLIRAPDGMVAGPFVVKAIAPIVPPTASFNYNCNFLVCDFDAATSYDSGGQIISYSWSFGASGIRASKTFLNGGTYSVTLTVTDNDGDTNSLTKQITVGSQVETPILNSVETVCNNNYCIRLLGSNFNANASVNVRDAFGSNIIAQFSGNDIYSRAPYRGYNKLQFPIQNLSLQKQLRTNGLCFSVVNNNIESIKQCIVRPNTAEQPSFIGKTVESYKRTGIGRQDIEYSSYVVTGRHASGGGNKLKIWGNSWKKIAYNYTVTRSTYLQVDFKADHQQAEVNGIGFIMNGSVDSTRNWQFYGTQNYGNQSFHDYSGTQWKTYKIPIGQSFTGQISDMVFMADEDLHVGQNVVYRNPILLEEVDQYDDVPSQRAYDNDNPGDAVPIYKNANAQTHNFHDVGDQDWLIFTQSSGSGVDIKTTQLGSTSPHIIAYRVDGDFSEVSPGRWDITLNDLTQVASDNTEGNNSVTIQNESGKTQSYVIKVISIGLYGADSKYHIQSIENNPFIDEFDDVPNQRTYDDDSPGDAVPIYKGAVAQTHNFHDSGDVDWVIFAQGKGSGVSINTTQLGNVSARLTAYRVVGIYTEVSPGRWDFTLDNLKQITNDYSSGNNSVVIQNTTKFTQVYVIKIDSSGAYGNNTIYNIKSIENNP